jgi:transposase
MQKHLLLRFKTNYHEQGKDDIFIDLPSSYMCCVELVPTRQHVLLVSRPEQLNTGLNGWLPMGLTDFGTASIPADQAVLLLSKYNDYEKNYGVLLEFWVTTKTCGMVCYCHTTWKRTTLYRSVCDNAKDYSIRWDLASRDLAVRLAKPILSDRKPLKKLPEWMKDPTIQLWCEDEVHFQRHSSLIRMWAPKGQQPRVLSPSVRHKVGFFGALNLKTGSLLTQEAPTFSSETFGDFIRYLLESTQGKIYLILDNARWHRAKDLKVFSESNQDRLIRVFLPPYSPELNPVERVWRITRRQVTHNRYFPSVEELRIALVSQFTKWEQPNNTLKALCANI